MIFGALEAGGTKMVVATVCNGNVLTKETIPTQSPEETMPIIIDFFKKNKVSALGIASFGPIDLNKNSSTYGYITSTPKIMWRNFNILSALQDALIVPCAFETDVNAAAIGEFYFGATKSLQNSIYVTIGTGIGFGVIIEGKPLHGMLHPEAGHILLKAKENDTFVGICPYHKACFEGLCSGPAIEKRAGISPSLIPQDSPIWDTVAFYIAQALSAAIYFYSPQRIVLGGGVIKNKLLLPKIRRHLKAFINNYIVTKELSDLDSYIVCSFLNDNQAILGAGKLAENLLQN